jgi:hypothetical protein
VDVVGVDYFAFDDAERNGSLFVHDQHIEEELTFRDDFGVGGELAESMERHLRSFLYALFGGKGNRGVIHEFIDVRVVKGGECAAI